MSTAKRTRFQFVKGEACTGTCFLFSRNVCFYSPCASDLLVSSLNL